jgi:hypothetical protein
MRDYYRAWVARMLASDHISRGFTHEHNAEMILPTCSTRSAAGDTSTPRFWIWGKDSTGRAPQDVPAFAGVCGRDHVARSVAEVKLPIDISVALKSPSRARSKRPWRVILRAAQRSDRAPD